MAVERIRQIDRLNYSIDQKSESKPDQVAVEEPLEVRINKDPLAVIMRTPGNDIELTAGLLCAEEIISDIDDIETIAHCIDGEDPDLENVINVQLSADCFSRMRSNETDEKMRRSLLSSSSCGVCGKRSIESLHVGAPPFAKSADIDPALILSLPPLMQEAQEVFDATGGIHAAAIFDSTGKMLVLREDIGRHNAVDKCVGALLVREALPQDNAVLMVSGRTSFEIIQKALVARIQTVAAVSAPSSLALELAKRSNMNLCGFVRGPNFNVYAGTLRKQP
jgi:FdhD protein